MQFEKIVRSCRQEWWSPKKSDLIKFWRELFENRCYSNAPGFRRLGEDLIDVGNRGMRQEGASANRDGPHECAVETADATSPSRVTEDLSLDELRLLKIDLEDAELDVPRGISDEHWGRTAQVAGETHDMDGRIDAIATRLKKSGYLFEFAEEHLLEGPGIFSIRAARC